MAKPPEPLREILPTASLVVEGSIQRVVSTAAEPARPELPTEFADKGTQAGAQVLVLKVDRVLKGHVPGGAKELTVHKPEAPYALKPGTRGAFLLDTTGQNDPVILGRYGPDSYRVQDIEKALLA